MDDVDEQEQMIPTLRRASPKAGVQAQRESLAIDRQGPGLTGSGEGDDPQESGDTGG